MTIRAHVPSAGHTVELELIVGAVDDAQAFVDVLQADAAPDVRLPVRLALAGDAVAVDVPRG